MMSPPASVSGRMREAMLSLRSLPWVRWEPGWDTVSALATMLYMIPSYYLMANDLHPLAIYNFLFASLFALVLLPAYYVLRVRGEPLEQLGITRRHLLLSLLISAVFGLRLMPRMLGLLSTVPPELVLPTVLFNGLCLWEPFFVHSWVQLRFERAFGVIPGILAAGFCLGSYHIGTYPPGMVLMLGIAGLIYGVVFRLTRNLLILWPLTWAVASTTGTVSGGYTFGWQTVWVYAVILLAQGAAIWWISRTRRAHEGDGFNDPGLDPAREGMAWRDWVLSGVYCSILVFQILFTFLNYNHMGLDDVANAGWAFMTLSAVFGWVPILTFRKKGGVPKGKSYVHTSVLVDSGIYAVVRHPQYLAGVLMSLASVLISQHWLNSILLFPVAVGFYLDSLRADRRLIEKFGHRYEEYMERVSGLNPLKGILGILSARGKSI